MLRRGAHLPILVVLPLLLGSCGDEPVQVAGGTLRVTLDEYAITPQKVRVRAGTLLLVARNDGRLNHNLRVELPRQDPASPERAVGGTRTARPGQTVSGPVLLRPGRYRLACTISNHDDLGMWGELEVTP